MLEISLLKHKRSSGGGGDMVESKYVAQGWQNLLNILMVLIGFLKAAMKGVGGSGGT